MGEARRLQLRAQPRITTDQALCLGQRFRVPFSFHLWKPVAVAPLGRIGDGGKMAATTLFLGGARSGKSRLAQSAAEALPGSLVYIATATAGDDEMADRIARHQDDRGPRWRTVEAPIALADAIVEAAPAVVLVDCLTLWLSNLMLGDHDIDRATQTLVGALQAAHHPLFLVSNEVGLGIVPNTPLGRRFRDAAGRLNQRIAAAVDRVEFVAAGLSMRLK